MKYNIIYADPPWSFNNKNTGGSMVSGAANKYPVMKLKDICNLPIKSICNDNSILFMWWVASQPNEALKVVEAWGFELKTMTGFTWVKETKHGLPFFGMGFWTRQGSENCIIATKGKIKPINHSIRAVEVCKIEEHSKKPNIFRDKTVQLIGNVPRVELFARQKYEGWHSWGNEVESDLNLIS